MLGFAASAVIALVVLALSPGVVSGQVEARPVLAGTAYLADVPLEDGVVVLHRVSDGSSGEVDSLRLGGGGVFSFALPRAPDPARGDIFFASVRHHGVLYFGPAITEVVELDEPYEIFVYDTILAPPEGIDVTMEGRSVFFEPGLDSSWRVTDLFQLRNDRSRTVVTRTDGRSWSYPLPAEASDVAAGEGELSADAISYENGSIVVRAALPPGERLFVVRYSVPTPYITIPTPGVTETFDVLVLEPIPPMEITGLEVVDRIAVDSTSVFRRYTAEPHTAETIEIVEIEEVAPPPVEWIAVVLALVLAGGGLLAFRGAGGATPAVVGRGPGGTGGAGGRLGPSASGSPSDRRRILVEIARLDEAFEAKPTPSEKERKRYERRREKLLERARGGS